MVHLDKVIRFESKMNPNKVEKFAKNQSCEAFQNNYLLHIIFDFSLLLVSKTFSQYMFQTGRWLSSFNL